MNKVHISLNVSDVEISQKFYETFLEIPASKVRPGYANFDLNNPPLKLAIQERSPQDVAHGNLSHLGIQVPNTEAVESAIKRLKQDGFATKEEKDEVCCYAKQDKVWVQDPDGNKWEIYTVTDEMESTEPLDSESCCAPKKQTACC